MERITGAAEMIEIGKNLAEAIELVAVMLGLIVFAFFMIRA
jgi:hypothetical protein